MISDKESTIVVIKGDAIMAGSKPSFFAPTGRRQPIDSTSVFVDYYRDE